MKAGFEWFRTASQDAVDNREYFKTKLPMPILGLNGTKLAPFPYVVEMRAPLAELVESQTMGSGHWIPDAVPEQLAKLLDDFLAKH